MTTREQEFFSEHIPFDTLAIAAMLEESGTPKKQAKVFAKLFGIVNTSHLANKVDVENIRKDIENMRKETSKEIEKLRKDTEQYIENSRRETKLEIASINSETKAEIIKWVAGMMIGQTAVIVGLIKFLAK